MRRGWILGLCVLAGCHSAGESSALERVADQEDRRVQTVTGWEPLLQEADSVAVRAAAARAVGRVRDPALGRLLRRSLAVEEDLGVQAELLFALGQCGDRESIPELAAWIERPEALLRQRAIEALGKLGDPSVVPGLVAFLGDSSSEVKGAAALALVRLRGRRVQAPPSLDLASSQRVVEALESGLVDARPGMRWKFAYALSELELPGREAGLVRGLAAAEPLVRLFSVRGLGRLAEGGAVVQSEGIAKLLLDEDPHVSAAAASALGSAAAVDQLPALLEAFQRDALSQDFHLRAAVAVTLGTLREPMPDESTPDESTVDDLCRAALRAALRDASPTVRASALRSLAGRDPASARPLVLSFLESLDVQDRLAGAQAAAQLSFEAIGRALLAADADRDVRVRTAALESLVAMGAPSGVLIRVLQTALAEPDVAIRGTALAGLRSCGGPEDRQWAEAASRQSPGSEFIEVRVEAVRAAAALGGADAVPFLRESLKDEAQAVARAASQALVELGESDAEPPAGRSVASSVSVQQGRDYGLDAPNPRAVLSTTKGRVVLELLREDAPRHVASFRRMAEAGGYDGLPFHRVVTGFVVQGLDPRGDGWGTGGVLLHDEIHPRPFEVGTVGMPNTGPDSGGCQLFITHVPTPHLDGRYTVFGRVVEGMDVVHSLEVDDLCREVTLRD